MAIDSKRIIGSPWTLLNVSDFIIIGLMSLLFMLMLQVLGMGWHRWNIWRYTGSAVSPMNIPTPPISPEPVNETVEAI